MSKRRYFGRVALAVASAAVLIAACSPDSPTSPNRASLSLTAAPTIGLSPTSLSFIVYVFRQPPPSKTLKITNLGGRTLTWTATSSRWLKIWPKTGTAPSTVTVSVNLAGSPIGINGYRPHSLPGSITVSAVGASNTPQTVPVILYLRYY
jgi:hypothetical protein